MTTPRCHLRYFLRLIYPVAPQPLFLSSYLEHPLLPGYWYGFGSCFCFYIRCLVVFITVIARMSVWLDVGKLGFDLRQVFLSWMHVL